MSYGIEYDWGERRIRQDMSLPLTTRSHPSKKRARAIVFWTKTQCPPECNPQSCGASASTLFACAVDPPSAASDGEDGSNAISSSLIRLRVKFSRSSAMGLKISASSGSQRLTQAKSEMVNA